MTTNLTQSIEAIREDLKTQREPLLQTLGQAVVAMADAMARQTEAVDEGAGGEDAEGEADEEAAAAKMALALLFPGSGSYADYQPADGWSDADYDRMLTVLRRQARGKRTPTGIGASRIEQIRKTFDSFGFPATRSHSPLEPGPNDRR